MADPRLSSIHLEAFPRREDFRRAREALLNARGLQTLAVERDEWAAGLREHHNTAIQSPDDLPSDARFWILDKENVYPLKVGLNTIGRLPDNDIVINDPCVSRRHCAILVHVNNGCELHDVASKNGTYLNGSKIGGPTHLNCGDEIRMCNAQIVFLSKDSPRLKGEPEVHTRTQCD